MSDGIEFDGGNVELLDSAGNVVMRINPPRPSTKKRVHLSYDTDFAIGSCTCGICGTYVDLDDSYCRGCGARLDGFEYEMIGESK